MANWDVIVIGLGGAGSSSAYHLAKQGLSVLGIDQFPPAHDRGSSHGMTRIIRQAYFEHSSYVPLLRRAYELWDALEHETQSHLFHRTGLVEIGPADGIVVPGVLQSAAEHGLDLDEMSVREVSRRWPGLTGGEDCRAVVERNAGYLRVEDCVTAHLQLARRAGAVLRHDQVVSDWSVNGDSVSVRLDGEVEHAGKLVLAAGPWSRQVLRGIDMPLQVLRKHQYWYQPRQRGYGESDGFPCFFHETAEGYFYGFPSIRGAGMKVSRHDGGTPLERVTAAHPADRDDQRLVESYLQSCLPGVGDNLLRQAGCYYTMTPDEHFLLDLHPEHTQVAIVAGLSGHGFKFTSVLGELVMERLTTGATSLDTSLMRVLR